MESCEQKLLRTTQTHIQRVRDELGYVIKDLSLMGDSVIMDCLNNGGIMSENAIAGCYDLRLRRFQLTRQDALEKVDRFMSLLEMYNSTYFNVAESTSALCGSSFLNRTELAVDTIMFQLDRCPYEILDEKTDYHTTTEDYDDSTEWYYLPRWTTTDNYETTTHVTTVHPN